MVVHFRNKSFELTAYFLVTSSQFKYKLIVLLNQRSAEEFLRAPLHFLKLPSKEMCGMNESLYRSTSPPLLAPPLSKCPSKRNALFEQSLFQRLRSSGFIPRLLSHDLLQINSDESNSIHFT